MARPYESNRHNPSPHYVSEPLRSQQRWPGGFYTGEGDAEGETWRQGERPHGWGNFEANYDLPSSELRRIDVPPGRANHRGKGPKGYARSDARTCEIICDQLTDDPRIDASEVDVSVENGEIRLTGSVDRRATKHLIEELVERCTGNGNIVNQLRVTRQSQDGWPAGPGPLPL